ncbi:MAG: helix-turn-helix transcriptional regulator [Flavobacteriales bacterium]|nr:helix-turn-helix transcriptional regulator [Flavobacteriales bacterium]MCB9363170.1 helix-turn-helix transcriptional regulator [Flavobacteriales bacterium]
MKEQPQEIEHKEYLIKLGKRVASIRTEKDLTQEDLAFQCGWDPANLRKIEGAKTNPTVKSLLILCKGLGIELKELMDF